ncbi:RnfH family protein [Halomonas sp. GXIMD04776]|uniref:RnfH family protein n=1 Tax=Halomonas sp. GXIMD04776 TaxID=3415605 RepID=UPI003CB89D76
MADDGSASSVPGCSETLTVEVAFALPEYQKIVTLAVPHGTTAREAVTQAQMEQYFPALPQETFSQGALGVFGKRLRDPGRYVLRAGDRIEIYRPLRIDPKQARMKRATRHASGSTR